MLNIEKYWDEIFDMGLFFAKEKGKLCSCNGTKCKDCDFYTEEGGMCRKNKLDWLCSEYVEKPTLTEQEWHYCMSAQTGWIARDKNRRVFVYNKKPKKNEANWGINGDFYSVSPNLSFDFIEWEDDEPWAVEDLLKLEVRKDEKE